MFGGSRQVPLVLRGRAAARARAAQAQGGAAGGGAAPLPGARRRPAAARALHQPRRAQLTAPRPRPRPNDPRRVRVATTGGRRSVLRWLKGNQITSTSTRSASAEQEYDLLRYEVRVAVPAR